MITLLTATPGAGKTAFAVKMLLEDANLKDRPIYTNITGLKLPHFPIDAEWLLNWHTNAPPGAFILFDECQDVFPPRHVSKAPPEYINLLSKHRKDFSVDFFIITQSPSLIDHAVKALVDRYLYIRQDGLIPMMHESRKVMDFEDRTNRETHPGTPYKLPKEVFDLYTSSQIHTKKPRRKLPMTLYVFGLAVLVFIGLGIYVYKERISPALDPLAKDAGSERGGGLPPAAAPASLRVVSSVPERILEAMTPTDDHNPLSAPLYAAVVPPVIAPEVVGCISSRKSCTCYSQQQTPVWIPEPQCRQRAAGLYYDPYRQPTQPEQWTGGTTPQTAAGGAAAAPAVPPAQASETPSAMI